MALALRSVPTPEAAGHSLSNANSRAPEPVPRSAMRNAFCPRGPHVASTASTTVSVSGLWTRGLGFGGNGHSQEFLDADKARVGLGREPPLRQRRNGRAFSRCEFARTLTDDAGGIETQRMAKENACIELRA